MDIALVLDKIRPNAAWRMADTYENLQATWEDAKQKLPTLEELETAWADMNKAPTASEIKKKNLQDLVDAYNVDVSAIRSKLVTYIAEGEAANADKITAERANLTSRKAQYTSDRAAILKS